jgi:hypothetical protein
MATTATRLSGLLAPESRARWALLRLLAALAALLVGFAVWSPWLVITVQPFAGAPSDSIHVDAASGISLALTLVFGQQSLVGIVTSPHLYSAATFVAYASLVVVSTLGLLIAPLFWQRTRTRSLRLVLIAYGVWLVAAAVVPLGLDAAIWIALGRRLSQATSRADGVTYSPDYGPLLLSAGLVVGWTTLVLLARQRPPALTPAAPVSLPPRTSRAKAGVTLISGGLLLWTAGFLAVPWAQVNCASVPLTLNHFVEGSCAGLDAGDALTTLLSSRIPAAVWSWSDGRYALYAVLLGGGVLALLAVWRSTASRTAHVWIALWLVAATAVTALSFRGVDHIAAAAPVMSSQATGDWHGATGIPLSFLGLLLAWVGMVALDGASRLHAVPPPSEPADGIPALAAPGE